MNPEDIQKLLESYLPDAVAHVEGDGHHFNAVIIANVFAGLSRLQRQQAVYAKIGQYITDGSIHALSFKTFTPEEWAAIEAQEKSV